MTRTIVFIAVVFGLLAWGVPRFFSGEADVVVADGFMSAETKDSYFEFDLGPAKQYSLHLLDLQATNGFLKKMGLNFHAAFLSSKHEQQFQKIIASGSCPASFLNKHGQNFMLAAVDDSVKSTLQTMTGRHNGAKISLSGNPLSFAMGETKGTQMQSFNSGGATMLLVDAINFN